MYIINGPPGAGKSTTAQNLAHRFEKSALISADNIQHMIVKGILWPDEEPFDESNKQLMLRDENIISLANNYFNAGFIPILDVVIANNIEFKRYLDGLVAKPLLIIVDAPIEHILERESKRGKTVAARWKHLQKIMRKELNDVCEIYDTSLLNTEAIVNRILKNGNKHA